jgi:hypothetical protein
LPEPGAPRRTIRICNKVPVRFRPVKHPLPQQRAFGYPERP